MKIALISDIHGNALALESVLIEIEEYAVDHVICLGDVATLGPQPGLVIEMLRSRNIPCILGNHDEFMISPESVASYTTVPVLVNSITATRNSLSRADIGFFGLFQPSMLLGEGNVLIYHGSPHSNVTNILPETNSETLDNILGEASPQIMVGGHTHIQMSRQYDGRLLLNPGSVGIPFKKFVDGGFPDILSVAEYAILDMQSGKTSVSLCRIDLDKRLLKERAGAWDNPLAKSLSSFYA